MSQPPEPRPTLTPVPRWAAWLRAWPGVITLLSVLAVLLGQAPVPAEGTPGSRMAAAPILPASPELRPAPAPTPAPGLPLVAPPEPRWTPPETRHRVVPAPAWTAPSLPRSLALLGRRQTDGG